MRAVLLATLLLPRLAIADASAPIDPLAPGPRPTLVESCLLRNSRQLLLTERSGLQSLIDSTPKADPDHDAYLLRKALDDYELALYDARERRGAIGELRAMIQAHPSWKGVDEELFALGYLLILDGKETEGRQSFQRLDRTFHDSAAMQQAYLVLGDLAFDRRDYAGALELFENVWQFGRCTALGIFRRGETQQQLGDAKGALESFTSLLRDHSMNPLVTATRSALVEPYATVGDATKARSFFQSLTGNDYQTQEMLRELGSRYRRAWNDGAAIIIEKDLAATSR
jgi:tetratricopeptide (TPR) repeat protein